ncbi:flagellar export protein FliJ [Uliginosibacterium sp. sgz301328]|uniref:flagellar export protein FliJ n=1 Tax=Uliginosibacterium sp. sgz301328 TaxID=3243764 RepID=UPI00359E0E9B
MTAKQTPLQMLTELAHTRVDEATRRLGELLATEQAGADRLQMLVQYRAEYRQRFLDNARDGIGPDAWRNYSAFLGKLDDAIAQQQLMVDRSRQMTAQGQEKWMAERNRMKAFDTLAARDEAREASAMARQEQRQNDEHTSNKFSRQSD